MVTAADRTSLHHDLLQHLGERSADTLMALLPMTPVDQLVTHRDLELFGSALRHELRGEMSDLRGQLRGEMSDLRGEMSELRGEMAEVRGEVAGLRGEVEGLGHRMDALLPRLVLTIVATLSVLVGFLGGAAALFG